MKAETRLKLGYAMLFTAVLVSVLGLKRFGGSGAGSTSVVFLIMGAVVVRKAKKDIKARAAGAAS